MRRPVIYFLLTLLIIFSFHKTSLAEQISPPQPPVPAAPAVNGQAAPAEPSAPSGTEQITPPLVAPPMAAPADEQTAPVIPDVRKPALRTTGAKPLLPEDAGMSFLFDDADIFEVIQSIFGDILKVNYLIDPRVKGRVNFRTVAPVAKKDIHTLMEVILRLNGIGVVEAGGLYRFVPIGEMQREPTPVGIGNESAKLAPAGKGLLQIVPLRFIKSSEMVKVLTPFLSATALIVDVPSINYIIIVDTDSNVRRLLQLAEIFDNEGLLKRTPRVFVHPVQNTKAKELASLLQQIFLGAKPDAAAPTSPTPTPSPVPTPRQPGAPIPVPAPAIVKVPTGEEAIVSDITRIIPDDSTNSLIILSTPDDYLTITQTIKLVDVVPRQVVIEALVASVTLDDSLSLGIQWSLKKAFGEGFKGFVGFGGDKFFAKDKDGNLTVPTDPLPTPGLSFFAAKGDEVKVFIDALVTANKANILSSPHLIVSDNREARIQVGRQVPIATSVTTGTTTDDAQTAQIQYKDVGTILKVKPSINEGGLVSLEVTQEVSDASPTKDPVLGTTQFVIGKNEVSTNLVVQDGQTIVIGGLISEKIDFVRSGIPLLSNIPVLGYLFGHTTDTKNKQELIILLTPRVIKNQADARSITREYVEMLKGVHEDIEIRVR